MRTDDQKHPYQLLSVYICGSCLFPMSVVLINPNLIVQRNDPFTTGIVYMPIGLAYVAAALRQAGISVTVIDAYAEKPCQARRLQKFMLLGMDETEVVARLPADVKIAFVYAINLTNHISTVGIVRTLKQALPKLAVVILENTQAVTAYALQSVMSDFFEAGADFVLTGEGEHRAVRLAQMVVDGYNSQRLLSLDGLGSPQGHSSPVEVVTDLDALPFPAWDLFPLENYWNLHFAHGPVTSGRYLPLLTSRGCPYPCKFCVIPATNHQKWRPRSAQNVVDEMEYSLHTYKVGEFHIEDPDPTISDPRIRQVCQEILRRGLKVIWKIAAGTKIETIRDEETLKLMAKAGCRYISISPETGSPRLLKLMGKPFDLEHAVRLVNCMNRVGIHSQACFILGYPGETEEDLQMTWDMVRHLTREGVDEIALFIITPVPGAEIYPQFHSAAKSLADLNSTSSAGGETTSYKSLSELTFSPAWRADYQHLNRFRLNLYIHFLWWKLWYHPLKLLRQPINFMRRKFDTKMEMVPYRALVLKWLDRETKVVG
jgi:anaerobic magnesium-protoporphyrin IX monomethyl ester cyclase